MSNRNQPWKRTYRRMQESGEKGWNRELYLNKRDGIIAGVCAGIGDYLGWAHWVVRLIFVLTFFMTGPVAIVAYLVGWMMLKPRPRDEELARRSRERVPGSQSIRLQRAQERLRRVTRRVEAMEAYVTSRQFRLDREFADLDR